AAVAQADDDVDAGLVQVQRMRVALAPVSEHGDLPVQTVDVTRLDDLGHVGIPFASDVDGGLRITGLGIPSRRAGAPEADAPGADELAHTVRADELLERLDLVGTADELEGDRVAADVGDLRARDLTERDELGTAVGGDADGDQRELALDRKS